MKYIVGNIYGDRKYLKLHNGIYTMQCIYCNDITKQSMNRVLKAKCMCRHDSIKYRLGDVINNRMIVGREKPNKVIVKCKDCNKVSTLPYADIRKDLCSCKKIKYIEYSKRSLFEKCKTYIKNILNNKPALPGKVNYDCNGLPICEICGLSFKKLGNHLRMSHKILTSDYKKKFLLKRKQSLMCKESILLARKRNLENYDSVVIKNLIIKGETNRFKKIT